MDEFDRRMTTTFAIGISGLFALVALGSAMEKKHNFEKNQENKQRAKVIQVTEDKKREVVEIFLDMDSHPRTAEACVQVGCGSDFSAQDIQQALSNNTEKTVWEWKKWGIFSKFEKSRSLTLK